MSLPQKDESGERSQVEHDIFTRALGAMLYLYASPRVHIVQQRCMPAPRADLYTRPYADRGWCCVEAAVSTAVSIAGKVVQITDSGTSTVPSRGSRLSPAEMDETLGKAFFTGKADRELVTRLYSEFVAAAQAYDAGMEALKYEA